MNLCSGMVDLKTEFYQIPNVLMYLTFRTRKLPDVEAISQRNSGTILQLSHDAGMSPTCKPENSILFLKTHKTGSSTLTNILNRYGDSRDLVFALPANGKLSFFWPTPFFLKSTMPTRRTPNILCNHARYNEGPMHWLFPKKTTRYITMLREPAKQFESVFNYYHADKTLKVSGNATSPLENFLQNAEFYLNKRRGEAKLLKNPALFDLGLHTEYHENLTAVDNYIHFLHQEFDLVLLMEYFDESLVLLKRRFCWKIEDILYFKLNERTDKEKQNITSHTEEVIRKLNSADVLLYNVFNQTLWKMIDEEGPEFFEDLALFRKKIQSMETACLKEGNFLTRPFGRKLVLGYAVKPNVTKELKETCRKMIMNEIPYLNYLRKKMIEQEEAVDIAVN